MIQVEVFAEIDAPPSVVWDALLSFDTYPEWDPIGRTIEGVAVETTARAGSAEPPDFTRLLDGPIAVTVDPGRRLAWLDRLVVPFAFDRYHEFHLVAIDGGERTRLLQRETVRGAFAPLAFDEARVERAFVEMNDAIAARAERRASANAIA
ncbi:SRPBCC domain-containing protein [Natrinema versiforme]|uniref:Polyketide cyclase/dehydrase n=1 Tax=Natrinema versiforme JCM 10478 TaxID=1227496 RepID=L9Y295_9EURY|nr:SRPBCC domain-containing protein [Natrinema versiforme]ELY66983.1 Polyketide cyclase/dehydrase [Natrinema versiforme JCM 10478]